MGLYGERCLNGEVRLCDENAYTIEGGYGTKNANADCLSRHPLLATHGAPILDWNRGAYNEAPATYFSMMAGLAPSPLVDVGGEDIWEDTQVLMFLQTHKYGLSLSALSKDKIYWRARSHRWMGSDLFRLQQRGVLVVVPRLAAREQITLDTHKGMGHFGVQQVLDRLMHNYWWRGMAPHSTSSGDEGLGGSGPGGK